MGLRLFALGGGDRKTFEFRCADCGEIHRGSPSFAYAKPVCWFIVPEDQRAERLQLDTDTCVLDGDEFYIRTILEIPILDAEEPFTWGVWVSQSEESFRRYVDTYDEDQSGDGSFGWLPVTMPGYDRTADRPDADGFECLGCDVTWRSPGQRPTLTLHENDHPLYHDQVNGISWDRAIELARLMMHPRD